MDSMPATPKTCSTGCGSFNYCLVAKIITASAAIPIIAAVAANFGSTAEWQFTIAAYSGAVVVLIAQKIDRLKSLAPMVCKKKAG